VTRIDIYTIHRKSEVGKAECLAVHRFDPKQNRNRPSMRKYTKKCPICQATKQIDDELRDIFRLR
jgi:predicted  nucleic acid-binding Zn ribbon protein